MEHWLKVLIGAVVGVVITLIFYPIFDTVYQKYRRRRERGPRLDGKNIDVPMKHLLTQLSRKRKQVNDEHMRSLINNDYVTEAHEAVAVLAHDGGFVFAVCAFLADMRVEYFAERVPDCCRSADAEARIVAAVMSAWSEAWRGAENVSLLCQDLNVASRFNDEDSNLSIIAREVEERVDCKIIFHWTENFLCHDLDQEELWFDLGVMAKKLLGQALKGNDVHKSSIWRDFPVGAWPRKKISVAVEEFHRLITHNDGPALNDEDDGYEDLELDLHEKLVDVDE